MDLQLIEEKWDERQTYVKRGNKESPEWLEFWKNLTSPFSRQFFCALRQEVKNREEPRVRTWLASPKQKQIMTYGDRESNLLRLEPFFRAHLIGALAAIKQQQDPHWPSRDRMRYLQGNLRGYWKKNQSREVEWVTLPLLRDLAAKLAGEEERQPDRIIIAPFALVPKGKDEAELAQFRFERITRGNGETSNVGDGAKGSEDATLDRDANVYLALEQVFLRIGKRFYESIFDSAKRSVQQLLESDRNLDRNCDVRVRIEEFDVQNKYSATELFSPEGRNERRGVLYEKQLMGRSASGAAAWGLSFVLTRKKPDPGLIVLAQVDSAQGVCSLEEDAEDEQGGPAELLKMKVRAIIKSGQFDTIAVVGENNKNDAEKAVNNAIKAREINEGDIVVVNIEEVNVSKT